MHPCASAYPTIELAFIPSGPAGIGATLDKMVELVRAYKKHPLIRQLAVELTQHLPSKAYTQEARELWQFVHTYIRYVKDIRGVETVQTPIRCLQNKSGDCDCHATLLAALLEAIGHKTRFVAMWFGPALQQHVLAETLIGDRWIPLETTVDRPFGWIPPGQVKRMVRHV